MHVPCDNRYLVGTVHSHITSLQLGTVQRSFEVSNFGTRTLGGYDTEYFCPTGYRVLFKQIAEFLKHAA